MRTASGWAGNAARNSGVQADGFDAWNEQVEISRYLGVGQTARKSWAWWRPVLLGRPDDERLQRLEYRIFKRDTLRPALAEINALADIEIEMLEFKSGRFVSSD